MISLYFHVLSLLPHCFALLWHSIFIRRCVLSGMNECIDISEFQLPFHLRNATQCMCYGFCLNLSLNNSYNLMHPLAPSFASLHDFTRIHSRQKSMNIFYSFYASLSLSPAKVAKRLNYLCEIEIPNLSVFYLPGLHLNIFMVVE